MRTFDGISSQFKAVGMFTSGYYVHGIGDYRSILQRLTSLHIFRDFKEILSVFSECFVSYD
jgi:hypothetical protein